MPELLKNYYNKEYFAKLCDNIKEVNNNFPKDVFLEKIFIEDWQDFELKQRMRHITICLNETLAGNYSDKISTLREIAPLSCKNSKHSGFLDMFYPDFVELYGLDDWQASIDALEHFTRYSSSEFAVRPFIKKDPTNMINQMIRWSKHNNYHVRRLASEGCRSRLPWAMALPQFKQDPSPIIPILENLKNDESEYVRRSVANNLNDISKDNPDLVIEIANKWYARNENTNKLVKHACRTLLKNGNKQVLDIFGYGNIDNINLESFKLDNNEINIGENILFDFILSIKSRCNLRLEYVVDFVKANSKSSKKIFKISEKTCEKGMLKMSRKHSFADLSTRKHYPGEHNISLVINGKILATQSFVLK